VDLFFTYVTVAIGLSLLVYIFALKNKKSTHLDDEQGDAWSEPRKDDVKDLLDVQR
jgi:MHS family alpha-ketoglutarate permease-like MFS transporter